MQKGHTPGELPQLRSEERRLMCRGALARDPSNGCSIISYLDHLTHAVRTRAEGHKPRGSLLRRSGALQVVEFISKNRADIMASEILVDIQEEVTCPICLDLMNEPMSPVCGHSFCQSCIPRNSTTSEISEEGQNSCPVCRTIYQPENLRPNRHLANIVERLRKVGLDSGKQPKLSLCVHHGEKLQLFCKEDGKVICWLCERLQEHRGHHTLLVEEAAQEYQEKLHLVLEQLRKDQKESEKLEADVRKEKAFWKNQIQNDRQRIQSEFNQLRGILDSEEQRELQNLATEEGKILDNLTEAENEMVKQRQFVRKLISDVEHRLQGSRMEMLQDVNDVMERSKGLTLKKPTSLRNEQRSVFRAPDLSAMLQVLRGEEKLSLLRPEEEQPALSRAEGAYSPAEAHLPDLSRSLNDAVFIWNYRTQLFNI